MPVRTQGRRPNAKWCSTIYYIYYFCILDASHTREKFCIETHLIFCMVEISRFLACVRLDNDWKKNHRLLILQLLMKIKVPAISNSGPVGTLCRQYCHKKKLTVLTPDFTRNWFSLLQTRWVPRETMADGLLCIWARDESSLSVSLYLYIYRYICLMMTI